MDDINGRHVISMTIYDAKRYNPECTALRYIVTYTPNLSKE